MSNHDVTITIQSTNQVDTITLSPAYVSLIFDVTPAQSVAAIREALEKNFATKAAAAGSVILFSWISENVTSST